MIRPLFSKNLGDPSIGFNVSKLVLAIDVHAIKNKRACQIISVLVQHWLNPSTLVLNPSVLVFLHTLNL